MFLLIEHVTCALHHVLLLNDNAFKVDNEFLELFLFLFFSYNLKLHLLELGSYVLKLLLVVVSTLGQLLLEHLFCLFCGNFFGVLELDFLSFLDQL